MKMWRSVLMIFLFTGSCYAITTEQCAQFDYLGVCSGNLQEAFQEARKQGNASEACNAIGTYINCVEYVACECELTTMSSVHNQLTYIGGIYTYQGCENATGPLTMNKGIPCAVNGSGSPTEGELLVLSTAESEIVLDLEDTCTGIKDCYTVYDKNAALALHTRNLTALCNVLSETISCLEDAACACGESTNENITDNVKSNHAVYTQTCNIITPDIPPKDKVVCSGNGTAVEPPVCQSGNPIYKCYLDLDKSLSAGNEKAIRCPALRTYIECTENVACQCGLIRSPAVYRAVTVAVASFNDSVCAEISGPLVVVSGIECPDGTGTTEEEDRLIIALSEDPSVLDIDSVCPGIKACYSALDEATGVALFEKNIKKLCAAQKIFIECMEETYCQCGMYGYENTTTYLHYQRENHVAACFTDSVLRDDFKCEYGSIGFTCMDDSDCRAISQSECSSERTCKCKPDHIYIPEQDATACVRDMRGTIGHPCFDNEDCQVVLHSECGTEKSCACERGYIYDDKTCKKDEKYGAIGHKCSSPDDCQLVSNSECRSSTICACKSGYLFKEGACIKGEAPKGGIGHRCSTHADCANAANSMCGTGGVCTCQLGYLYTSKTCTPVSSAVSVIATYTVLSVLLTLSVAILL